MPISILYLSHPNRQYALDLIGAYSDGFARRILRGFANIEPEATAAAEALFNERMNRVCGPDGPDEDAGSVADDAREHGFSVYSDLEFVRRLVTGLAIAGLYHLWERLLKEFLVRNSGNFARRLFLGTKCLLLPMTYLPVRRVTQNASWPSRSRTGHSSPAPTACGGTSKRHPRARKSRDRCRRATSPDFRRPPCKA